MTAKNDNEVFAPLFRSFFDLSGHLFGVAVMFTDRGATEIVGRFGVPNPDSLKVCRRIAEPVVDMLRHNAVVTRFDAGENPAAFHHSIRQKIIGTAMLLVPLIPSEGELFGIAVLYRRGEQPFTDNDRMLADLMVEPAGRALKRVNQK
jgi:GAF domain-containing protein